MSQNGVIIRSEVIAEDQSHSGVSELGIIISPSYPCPCITLRNQTRHFALLVQSPSISSAESQKGIKHHAMVFHWEREGGYHHLDFVRQ